MKKMKKLKSVTALILAVLMIMILTACGGGAAPTAPAPPPAPEVSATPADEDSGFLSPAPEDIGIAAEGQGDPEYAAYVGGEEYYPEVFLPQLDLELIPGGSAQGAAAINRRIEALAAQLIADGEAFDDSESGHGPSADYAWAQFGGVLSLMVDYDFSGYGPWEGTYLSWNLDILSGELLTPDEVMARAGYEDWEVQSAVMTERQANWVYLEDKGHFSEWSAEFRPELAEKYATEALDSAFVEEMNAYDLAWAEGQVAAFWGNDGWLWVRYPAVSLAGSGSYPVYIHISKDARDLAVNNDAPGAIIAVVNDPTEEEIELADPVDKIYTDNEDGLETRKMLLTTLTDYTHVVLHYVDANPYTIFEDELYIWDAEFAGESIYLEVPRTTNTPDRLVMMYIYTQSDGGRSAEYYFHDYARHGSVKLEYAGDGTGSDDFGLGEISQG